MIRVAFVMEQHLGHKTFYENLRQFIAPMQQIDATWIDVTYKSSNRLWNFFPFLSSNLRGSLIGMSQVRTGLSRGSFDVALFNSQVPAALGGNMVYKQPFVLCTDVTPLQYDQIGEDYGHQADQLEMLREEKHRVNAHLFQKAARLLPWSTWTQSSLIHEYGVPTERIEVIPPGTNLDIWQPIQNRPEGPLRILFVGGDFHRKGGELLLEACNRLPKGSFELILVTKSLIPTQKGVTTYNHLNPNSMELVHLYQSCDVFVLPTRAETFGIAAVEASASGLPVIATRVGGLMDIVVDGETGFLISLNNLEELVSRLKTLIDNVGLRRQMGQAARARAVMHFNAQKNAMRVAEILFEVASA